MSGADFLALWTRGQGCAGADRLTVTLKNPLGPGSIDEAVEALRTGRMLDCYSVTERLLLGRRIVEAALVRLENCLQAPDLDRESPRRF